eukprot:NODE_102_length_19640_cov_1.308735.p12 type:complete len:176 gc:universal NODE_102_length_19640_cov_1.308735:14425-14952(+)
MLSKIFRLNCLKCHSNLPHPFVFCGQCKELQNIPNLNYFELFAIKPEIQNPANLKQKYRILQSLSHPDRHNNEDSAQKMSSFVSKAFDILSDPFLKAEYALKLKNVVITDFDSVPQCFLMQVMELNENDDIDVLDAQILDLKNSFWSEYKAGNFINAKDVLLRWKFLNSIKSKFA